VRPSRDGLSGDDEAESLPLPFYDVEHRGASAIYASAYDLVTFGMFHLKERLDDGTSILKRGSIDAMQRIQTHESPTERLRIGLADQRGPPRRPPCLAHRRCARRDDRAQPVSERACRANQAGNPAVVPFAQELAALVMPQYGWRLRQAHRSGRE
jgi:hypothetical protein